eukprot:13393264-Ditylum_brightwellii.AAC.1
MAPKDKLYTLEQGNIDKNPRTSNWVFVLFALEGNISLDQITRMVRAQNDFLADQTSIAVIGILNVDNIMKADPDNNEKSLC